MALKMDKTLSRKLSNWMDMKSEEVMCSLRSELYSAKFIINKNAQLISPEQSWISFERNAANQIHSTEDSALKFPAAGADNWVSAGSPTHTMLHFHCIHQGGQDKENQKVVD